jgi:hypothetical protein
MTEHEFQILNNGIKDVKDTQIRIFDKIDKLEQSFSAKQINCETRFTTIETESKLKSKINGAVFGIIGTGIVLFLKWIISKIPFGPVS